MKIKNTITAMALIAIFVLGSIPADAGIIIRGRGDDGKGQAPPPACQQQQQDRSGTIIRGLVGIIRGITGITILDQKTSEDNCQ